MIKGRSEDTSYSMRLPKQRLPLAVSKPNEFGKSIPLRAKSGSMLLLSILNTETRNSSCLSRHRRPNVGLSSGRAAKPTEWCAGRLLGPVGLKYRTGKTLDMNRLLELGTRGANYFPLMHGYSGRAPLRLHLHLGVE